MKNKVSEIKISHDGINIGLDTTEKKKSVILMLEIKKIPQKC